METFGETADMKCCVDCCRSTNYFKHDEGADWPT